MMQEEVIGFFDRPGVETVVDGTLGGAGHAVALLDRIARIKLLLGIDRDQEAVERCQRRLAPYKERVKIWRGSFFDLEGAMEEMGVERADAILLDLGVSSFQLDDGSRGFSFLRPGPLDMRMDKRQQTTAATIVNTYPEKDISRLLFTYGEERYARRLASAIVRHRTTSPFETTADLVNAIEAAYPKKSTAKISIHPATRTFQALRIAVNGELDQLEKALKNAVSLLNPGGRIAVITFHSLEDRIVKRLFADLTPRCVCPKESPVCHCDRPGSLKIVTKKPVVPSAAEIARNPRSRSAKLRVAERLAA